MIKRPSGTLWLDTFPALKTADAVPGQDLRERWIVPTGGTDGMGRIAFNHFTGVEDAARSKPAGDGQTIAPLPD